MAIFSLAPRVWARLKFEIEWSIEGYSYYPYDRYYSSAGPSYITHGVPALVVRHDMARIAFNTADCVIHTNPPTQGRLYAITPAPEGEEVSSPILWGKYGVTTPTQGLAVPSTGTEASPLWSLTAGSVPPSSPASVWSGEYSADGAIFASLLRNVADDTKVYLSVKQDGTIVTDKALLGIRHIDYLQYRTEFRKLETRMVVFAADNIWIFHVNESAAGAGDRKLYLSVWGGASVTSTSLIDLGPYSVLTFDAVRGTTGLVYLVYALFDANYPYTLEGPVNGRSFVRSVSEATRSVSAVLHTSPILEKVSPEPYRAMQLHEGDRLPSNRVFTYKGVNYIVHVYAGQATVVYTYADAAPSTITLLRWGFIDYWTGTSGPYTVYQSMSDPSMQYGRVTGIEYDPDSDQAYLVAMVPNAPAAMPSADEFAKDRTRVYVTRHWQALDAPTWGMQVEILEELPGYVWQAGDANNEEIHIGILGYVPSRLGGNTQGALFFQTRKNTGANFLVPYMHVVRTSCWHTPETINAEVEVVATVSVLAEGNKLCDSAAEVRPLTGVTVAGVRNRSTAWATYWLDSRNAFQDGQTLIDLAPAIEVVGGLAAVHEGDVLVDLADAAILVSGETERQFLLRHEYWAVGTTFLDEFLGYINEERATVHGLPPIKTMGYTALDADVLRTIDIAQTHCNNMAATRWYAHGAAAFPQGWQTTHERVSKITEVGSENLQYFARLYGVFKVIPTASDVFLAWKNSPPHYANMMTDWGAAVGAEATSHIFSTLAFSYGRMPEYDGGGPPYDIYPIEPVDPVDAQNPDLFALYWTNNFLLIKENYVEATLTERWQTEALEIALVSYRWDKAGLHHTTARHDSPYALPLGAHHAVLYANLAASCHTSISTHSVSERHAVENTRSIGGTVSAFDTPYDLRRHNATVWNTAQWTNTLTGAHAIDYDETLRTYARHAATYDEPASISVSLSAPYDSAFFVAARHGGGYAIRRRLSGTHTASMLLGARLAAAHEASFWLEVRNAADGRFSGVYDLDEGDQGAVFVEPQTVVFLNGRTLEVDDGYVSCDYDSPGFTFQCTVNDLEFVRGARQGDRLEVVFEGTPYAFFLSNLAQSSTERSAAERVTLHGLSPVFLLDTPYAETTTYAPASAKMFSEIVQELLGVPVDFGRHIDWMVPYGRAQGATQTPLSLARALLASVGSRLLSNPDGSLYVLARYPAGFDALPTGVPTHALDETNHVFTRSSSFEYAQGYNRFRVRDADASYDDIIEFDKETSTASVWVSPYRSSWQLGCTTTPGVTLMFIGEEVEEREELLDFRAGAANTEYPMLGLVSVVWVTDSLGGVSFDPYSRKVVTPLTVNHGYGLARVTYHTKVSKFLLSSSVPIEATQLIIVEQ